MDPQRDLKPGRNTAQNSTTVGGLYIYIFTTAKRRRIRGSYLQSTRLLTEVSAGIWYSSTSLFYTDFVIIGPIIPVNPYWTLSTQKSP